MSVSPTRASLIVTDDGSYCYKLEDTINSLTAIQGHIEKILKGTNPTDNRNQLLNLYRDITSTITTLQTYASERRPIQVLEQRRKIRAEEETRPTPTASPNLATGPITNVSNLTTGSTTNASNLTTGSTTSGTPIVTPPQPVATAADGKYYRGYSQSHHMQSENRQNYRQSEPRYDERYRYDDRPYNGHPGNYMSPRRQINSPRKY